MQVWRSFWCMYHTFVSPVSCYVGVKIFLMYVLYFCQPCLMLCRCEDLSDAGTILLSALPHAKQVWRSFWCMYHTFVSPVSCYVGVKIFLMYALYFCQPCLMLCRCEDLSDVCPILLSALSHVCRCEDHSDVCTILLSAHFSCYVGVKIFLMYVLYFCQPCLMLCRCEDLSDVCTILLSAHFSCYVGVKIFLMYVLYFCQPCLMLCRCEDLSDVGTILFSALSHVMQVWRSFWCMYHTFISPVSCYVGVKIFLMYVL